ncbi:MAG TPA: hypothetical protein PKA11_09720 [Accumulibacter sp.]|nr:hypothetical protein [Accumulibacter sp.]
MFVDDQLPAPWPQVVWRILVLRSNVSLFRRAPRRRDWLQIVAMARLSLLTVRGVPWRDWPQKTVAIPRRGERRFFKIDGQQINRPAAGRQQITEMDFAGHHGRVEIRGR